MVSEQVSGIFRNKFEPFLSEKGLKWNNGCFAGYKNRLFSYVALIETRSENNEEIDVIYRVLPEFYVNEANIITVDNELPSLRMVARLKNRELSSGLKNAEDFFNDCLELLYDVYDDLFAYKSVTDYADGVIFKGKLMIEYATRFTAFSNTFGNFPGLDFTYLAYSYLIKNKSEKCKIFIMELINAYKILLYDRMKYGNLAELEEKLTDDEEKKLDLMFENYSKVTRFAEALFECNRTYFAELDKLYSTRVLEGRNYIKEFLN